MKTILTLLLAAVAVSSMTSCRTMAGAGNDISRLGNKLEREANQHDH